MLVTILETVVPFAFFLPMWVPRPSALAVFMLQPQADRLAPVAFPAVESVERDITAVAKPFVGVSLGIHGASAILARISSMVPASAG